MESKTVSKLSNAFSTGGGGVNFENDVQAVFLLSLLIDGFSPIMNEPIKQVSFQGKIDGYDTDDLIVTTGNDDSKHKLLCQIKHEITTTKNNEVFKEVIAAAWKDFCKDLFDKINDKIALFTGKIALSSLKSLEYINEQANVCLDEKEFLKRISEVNYSNGSNRNMLSAIKECIKEANNQKEPTDYELWKFCKVFITVVFDLDYLNSINKTLSLSLIRCNSSAEPYLVWSTLCKYASDCNQRAAKIDINNIDVTIKRYFEGNKYVINYPTSNMEYDKFVSLLILVGSWSGDNDNDKSTIEKISGMNYVDFESRAKELLISNPDYMSLTNGIWKFNFSDELFYRCTDFYFDDTVQKLFLEGINVFSQNNKRIELGTVEFLSSGKRDYENSSQIREGIATGMCLISTNIDRLNNCNKNRLENTIYEFYNKIFDNCNWLRWASLSDCFFKIIEIEPQLYLKMLETNIINNSNEILKLFPKSNASFMSENNYISYILWSLEVLSWSPDYLVKSISCLGMLEALNYDKTNWSNTPINSIVSIMLSWHPQTLANLDKRKNAIKCLCNDNSDVAWRVIVKLLPDRTKTSTSNPKPKFLNINIPDKISVTITELKESYKMYIDIALELADNNPNKISILAKNISNMSEEQLNKYLELAENVIKTCSEDELFDLWLHLDETLFCAKNEKIILNKTTVEHLDKISKLAEPKNICLKYKKLYFGNRFLYGKGDFKNNWEYIESEKEKAIKDIYMLYGILETEKFGVAVDELYDVGCKLGNSISISDLNDIVSNYNENRISRILVNGIINSFVRTKGIDTLLSLKWSDYNELFIADILSMIHYSSGLLNIVHKLLENPNVYWEKATIPYLFVKDETENLEEVLKKLMSCKRYVAACNLAGHSELSEKIDSELIYDLLEKAGTIDSIGDEKFDSYAIRDLIEWVQNQPNVDIDRLSNIEFIYLPFLGDSSETKPKALRTRISEDASYFCALMEIYYKKHSSSESSVEINQVISERLFSLLWRFDVIPGMSWKNIFSSEKFKQWITYVKDWSKENDRYAVCMHTIGSGLSYATLDSDGLPEKVIMEELNLPENIEMRKGYKLGIINQRGVHFVDPSGEPEMLLAKKYDSFAAKVEAKGYNRYSQVLREIADNYVEEAKRNIQNHKLSLEND